MAGMTDLDEMLRTLTVSARPGRFTFVTVPGGEAPPIGDGVEAVLRESEGDTVVATVERAAAEGWSHDFEAAWLTLDVHSALEAVGLTAAFSAALGAVEIPCNVLAAFHHDHLLVPADRVDEAVAALEALRDR
ncbi:MAG: ACT domain-containing protein [Actinomycetota bacterium]